jgi:hypothetical protein
LCETCDAFFYTTIRNLVRGGGRFCSKKCNPAFVRKFTKAQKARRNNLKSKYGLTEEQFDAMVEAQGNRCAVCGSAPGFHGKLHVDHCHSTGKIRGLLCTQCNIGAGMVGDDAARLRALAAYLESFA